MFAADPEEPAQAAEAAPPTAPTPDVAAEPGEETPEMRRLRLQIASDREAIKELSSSPGTDTDVLGDPRLRELAERVAHMQEELEALRQEPSP